MSTLDSFGARATLETADEQVVIYRLDRLEQEGVGSVSKLPYSIKVLLEAALRQLDGFEITDDDVSNLAQWDATRPSDREIPFKPARG